MGLLDLGRNPGRLSLASLRSTALVSRRQFAEALEHAGRVPLVEAPDARGHVRETRHPLRRTRILAPQVGGVRLEHGPERLDGGSVARGHRLAVARQQVPGFRVAFVLRQAVVIERPLDLKERVALFDPGRFQPIAPRQPLELGRPAFQLFRAGAEEGRLAGCGDTLRLLVMGGPEVGHQHVAPGLLGLPPASARLLQAFVAGAAAGIDLAAQFLTQRGQRAGRGRVGAGAGFEGLRGAADQLGQLLAARPERQRSRLSQEASEVTGHVPEGLDAGRVDLRPQGRRLARHLVQARRDVRIDLPAQVPQSLLERRLWRPGRPIIGARPGRRETLQRPLGPLERARGARAGLDDRLLPLPRERGRRCGQIARRARQRLQRIARRIGRARAAQLVKSGRKGVLKPPLARAGGTARARTLPGEPFAMLVDHPLQALPLPRDLAAQGRFRVPAGLHEGRPRAGERRGVSRQRRVGLLDDPGHRRCDGGEASVTPSLETRGRHHEEPVNVRQGRLSFPLCDLASQALNLMLRLGVVGITGTEGRPPEVLRRHAGGGPGTRLLEPVLAFAGGDLDAQSIRRAGRLRGGRIVPLDLFPQGERAPQIARRAEPAGRSTGGRDPLRPLARPQGAENVLLLARGLLIGGIEGRVTAQLRQGALEVSRGAPIGDRSRGGLARAALLLDGELACRHGQLGLGDREIRVGVVESLPDFVDPGGTSLGARLLGVAVRLIQRSPQSPLLVAQFFQQTVDDAVVRLLDQNLADLPPGLGVIA